MGAMRQSHDACVDTHLIPGAPAGLSGIWRAAISHAPHSRSESSARVYLWIEWPWHNRDRKGLTDIGSPFISSDIPRCTLGPSIAINVVGKFGSGTSRVECIGTSLKM